MSDRPMMPKLLACMPGRWRHAVVEVRRTATCTDTTWERKRMASLWVWTLSSLIMCVMEEKSTSQQHSPSEIRSGTACNALNRQKLASANRLKASLSISRRGRRRTMTRCGSVAEPMRMTSQMKDGGPLSPRSACASKVRPSVADDHGNVVRGHTTSNAQLRPSVSSSSNAIRGRLFVWHHFQTSVGSVVL